MHNLRLHQAAVLAIAAIASLAVAPLELAADAPAALDQAPQSAAMRNSVVTVDALITSENQQALARSREQSIASGLSQPEAKAVVPSGPVAGQLSVGSIYGFEGNLRANVAFNGEIYENLRVGSRIGACSVASIKPALIVLASRRGAATAACPSAKWTGVPSIPTAEQLERVKAAVLGMPSPATPTPFSSAGAPGTSFPSATRGPAPLKVSQPTIQLIPGGPMAAGQTAVPLVPRQLEPVQDERLQQTPATN